MSSADEAKGDCFEVALTLVVNEPDLVLVHGLVTGQGDIEGVVHWHAWCERTDTLEFPNYPPTELVVCIDQSNGHDVEMPKAIYYRIGRIDPDQVRRYEREEAMVTAVRIGHYGPWD